MDADGRLSCEEFVLALHLCDMARAGETLPASLPPNLVPPTLRRVRNNSLTASEQGDANGTGINQGITSLNYKQIDSPSHDKLVNKGSFCQGEFVGTYFH